MFARTSFTKVDQDLVKITDGRYRIMELHAAASIPSPILIAFPSIYVTNFDALEGEYAPCKSNGIPRPSTLTETAPFLLIRTDPGCPERGQGDRGINAAGSSPRLCRESPLTPWRGDTLAAAPGMGFNHPRRLPRGECGVWGRAPRCSNSHRTFLPPIIYRDHHPINSSDRTHSADSRRAGV